MLKDILLPLDAGMRGCGSCREVDGRESGEKRVESEGESISSKSVAGIGCFLGHITMNAPIVHEWTKDSAFQCYSRKRQMIMHTTNKSMGHYSV